MEEISPIAMPGTHESFLEYLQKQPLDEGLCVLDVGAGHGAFTKKLFDLGYTVSACDFFPEKFEFEKVECRSADITRNLPYEDDSFDLVIAIEVSEHILDHEIFFGEISRILKPDGTLFLSTPNVLSLKSRMRFLMGGFHYSFGPLDYTNFDGLQHVASLTLDQYNYAAVKNGFKKAEFDIDKVQRSSFLLLILLFPFILLGRLFEGTSDLHSNKKLLLGRLLFLSFSNDKG